MVLTIKGHPAAAATATAAAGLSPTATIPILLVNSDGIFETLSGFSSSSGLPITSDVSSGIPLTPPPDSYYGLAEPGEVSDPLVLKANDLDSGTLNNNTYVSLDRDAYERENAAHLNAIIAKRSLQGIRYEADGETTFYTSKEVHAWPVTPIHESTDDEEHVLPKLHWQEEGECLTDLKKMSLLGQSLTTHAPKTSGVKREEPPEDACDIQHPFYRPTKRKQLSKVGLNELAYAGFRSSFSTFPAARSLDLQTLH